MNLRLLPHAIANFLLKMKKAKGGERPLVVTEAELPNRIFDAVKSRMSTDASLRYNSRSIWGCYKDDYLAVNGVDDADGQQDAQEFLNLFMDDVETAAAGAVGQASGQMSWFGSKDISSRAAGLFGLFEGSFRFNQKFQNYIKDVRDDTKIDPSNILQLEFPSEASGRGRFVGVTRELDLESDILSTALAKEDLAASEWRIKDSETVAETNVAAQRQRYITACSGPNVFKKRIYYIRKGGYIPGTPRIYGLDQGLTAEEIATAEASPSKNYKVCFVGPHLWARFGLQKSAVEIKAFHSSTKEQLVTVGQYDTVLGKVEVKEKLSRQLTFDGTAALPELLAVQLKRFSSDAFGHATKVKDRVTIQQTLTFPTADGTTTKFYLQSMVLHVGVDIGSGHYIAHARVSSDENKFYLFDDESAPRRITPGRTWSEEGILIDDTVKSQIYLMFYKKCPASGCPPPTNTIADNIGVSQSTATPAASAASPTAADTVPHPPAASTTRDSTAGEGKGGEVGDAGESADTRSTRSASAAASGDVERSAAVSGTTAVPTVSAAAGGGDTSSVEKSMRAIANYARYHKLPVDGVTIDQVANSSAGIEGWANSADGGGSDEEDGSDDGSDSEEDDDEYEDDESDDESIQIEQIERELNFEESRLRTSWSNTPPEATQTISVPGAHCLALKMDLKIGEIEEEYNSTAKKTDEQVQEEQANRKSFLRPISEQITEITRSAVSDQILDKTLAEVEAGADVALIRKEGANYAELTDDSLERNFERATEVSVKLTAETYGEISSSSIQSGLIYDINSSFAGINFLRNYNPAGFVPVPQAPSKSRQQVVTAAEKPQMYFMHGVPLDATNLTDGTPIFKQSFLSSTSQIVPAGRVMLLGLETLSSLSDMSVASQAQSLMKFSRITNCQVDLNVSSVYATRQCMRNDFFPNVFRVGSVKPGSAAEYAGVAANDVLNSIDVVHTTDGYTSRMSRVYPQEKAENLAVFVEETLGLRSEDDEEEDGGSSYSFFGGNSSSSVAEKIPKKEKPAFDIILNFKREKDITRSHSKALLTQMVPGNFLMLRCQNTIASKYKVQTLKKELLSLIPESKRACDEDDGLDPFERVLYIH